MTQRKWVPGDACVRDSWGFNPAVTHLGKLWTGNSELGSKPESFSKRAKTLWNVSALAAHESPTFHKAGFLSLPNLTLNLKDTNTYTWPGIAVLLWVLHRHNLAWDLIPSHPTLPPPHPLCLQSNVPWDKSAGNVTILYLVLQRKGTQSPTRSSLVHPKQGFLTFCPSWVLHSREHCQWHKSLTHHHAGLDSASTGSKSANCRLQDWEPLSAGLDGHSWSLSLFSPRYLYATQNDCHTDCQRQWLNFGSSCECLNPFSANFLPWDPTENISSLFPPHHLAVFSAFPWKTSPWALWGYVPCLDFTFSLQGLAGIWVRLFLGNVSFRSILKMKKSVLY